MPSHPKSILVLGHSGFIGSRLCGHLLEKFPRARLWGLSHRRRKRKGMRTFACDLRDAGKLKRILRRCRPDWVFHMAGKPSGAKRPSLYEDHLIGTATLLQVLEQTPGRGPRIVLPGSAAEYGVLRPAQLPVAEDAKPNPVSPYGAIKSAQAALSQVYAARGLDIVLARIFNVLGPGLDPHLAISAFVKQIAEIEQGLRPPVLRTGNLAPKRDFVDIADTVRALVILAQRGRPGQAYNICSGKSVSIKSLVGDLARLSRRRFRTQLSRDLLRKTDILDIRGSTRKIVRDTGWKARITPLESMRAMLEAERRSLRSKHGRKRHKTMKAKFKRRLK